MALVDIVIDEISFEIGVASALTGGSMVDVCFENVVGDRSAIAGGSVQGVSYDGNNFTFSTTGSTPTLPAETDVRDGIQYGLGGTEFTGNVILPVEADVKVGTQYGANGTEFTGELAGGGGNIFVLCD